MDYNSYFLASGNQKYIEYNTDQLIPVRAEAIVYKTQQSESTRKSLAKDDEDEEEWVKLVRETYYDLGPVNKQRISFTNSDHIESDIMYNNVYGWSNDKYVEYSDDGAIEGHLVLDRTYSNYEDIGQ